ncbi:MAG: presenilin family intramembrane aspartyl protease [Candidatus Undinarchaeales archaeon]
MSRSRASSKKHKMNFRPRAFVSESVIFLLTQFLGLLVGIKLASFGLVAPQTTTAVETVQYIWPFILSFSIATVAIIIGLKYLKGGSIFKGLMAFLVFYGGFIVFSVFIPDLIALVLAITLVVLRFKIANLLTQNIAMMIAIAGIGAMIGSELPIYGVILLLAILSVYDFVAVFKTKHMVSMFKGMFEKGAPFTIIVPEKLNHVKAKVKKTKPGEGKFLMLGTGDLAFPIILAVSVIQSGLINSFAVILGAFIGLIIVHSLLMTGKYKAIPALPPIAIFSVLFFLISHFIL